MNRDKLEIEVLPDGLIKVSTDAVSLPNHVNCERFLREIARLAGGATKREAKHPHAHHHHHDQEYMHGG